ncbi:MAG: Rne/Rng family ribonuclease [Candidatus Lernaella stagnicola]|nr:Rne/Rng family ribonuclease [Candidatus Lernaella stagnicola]
MPDNELIINVTHQEKRVALLENGHLAELHIELAREQGIVGNIYKGRVTRVLPGMQAAFVDIGLDRAAFLYVADVRDPVNDIAVFERSGDDADSERVPTLPRETSESFDEVNMEMSEGAMPHPVPAVPIEDLLREGQEIMVQVAKEPIGTKGARITSHISLPGRNLVLMPYMDHVGVSRRIDDEEERARLKEVVEQLRPTGMGFIVRTAAEGKDREALVNDVEFLVEVWKSVQKKYDTAKARSLLHSDLSITLRAIRDLFRADIGRVLIDSRDEYDKIMSFFGKHMPRINCTVDFYDEAEPVFDHFGLEVEIARALQPKVWLKSGGYIIIEQTEALTAIDVNTGRFVGKHNLEDTILKTNLEAIKEICFQLRLRNIGGLIIIDFIDMEKEGNREKVFRALQEQLTRDRAKTNILKISELGLVEMTRKRTRESIARVLSEPCPYCEGKGYVKSKTAICGEIFREIKKEVASSCSKSIILHVHPEIADLLYEEERAGVEFLEESCGTDITIKDNSSFHLEQFEIICA